jgi:protoheme IX farnesyltransferase
LEKETTDTRSSFTLSGKLRDYMMLIKFSLSFMVVFSAVVSFLLVPRNGYNFKMIVILFVGGLLVTGSANAINQVVERDTDAMTKRTAKRPVASGRMSVAEGWGFAIITGILGVAMLWYFFNMSSAMLAAFSLFLYAFIYTPLKKVNSVSVLVGAFPGALPCLIGWCAGFYDDPIVWKGGWALFAIQFFWQFPHFWAIAWISHKDYSNAGFKLMPSVEGPTKYSAIQAIIYSLLLLPVGLLPYYTGICEWAGTRGVISFLIVLVANLFMIWQSVRLYREMEVKAARRVMFSSYIYLPVVLLALLAAKA